MEVVISGFGRKRINDFRLVLIVYLFVNKFVVKNFLVVCSKEVKFNLKYVYYEFKCFKC